MRLAICDDDLKEVENLKEQLNAYQHLHEDESFVYKAYSDPFVFLEDWKKNPCDIAMLDIVMPHMSGIQLGSEARLPSVHHALLGTQLPATHQCHLRGVGALRPAEPP